MSVKIHSKSSTDQPPRQFMSVNQQSMVKVGCNVDRIKTKVFDQIEEEAFRGGKLQGGIGSGGPIQSRTFTCKNNLFCIPVDIITCCHCCTGSVCCGCRPTIYDSCRCLRPFETKTIDMDDDGCYEACCGWRKDWFLKKGDQGSSYYNVDDY